MQIVYWVCGVAGVAGGLILIRRRFVLLSRTDAGTGLTANEGVAYGLVWLFSGIVILAGLFTGSDRTAAYGLGGILVGSGVFVLIRLAWVLGRVYFSQAEGTDDSE
jgi:hypothetical protein